MFLCLKVLYGPTMHHFMTDVYGQDMPWLTTTKKRAASERYRYSRANDLSSVRLAFGSGSPPSVLEKDAANGFTVKNRSWVLQWALIRWLEELEC